MEDEPGGASEIQERSSYKVFVGKPEVNKPLLILVRGMRIILRCI
jgi:hypothetical protein